MLLKPSTILLLLGFASCKESVSKGKSCKKICITVSNCIDDNDICEDPIGSLKLQCEIICEKTAFRGFDESHQADTAVDDNSARDNDHKEQELNNAKSHGYDMMAIVIVKPTVGEFWQKSRNTGNFRSPLARVFGRLPSLQQSNINFYPDLKKFIQGLIRNRFGNRLFTSKILNDISSSKKNYVDLDELESRGIKLNNYGLGEINSSTDRSRRVKRTLGRLLLGALVGDKTLTKKIERKIGATFGGGLSFEKNFGSSGGSAALDDGGGRNYKTEMNGGRTGTDYRTSGYTGRNNKGYDTDVDVRAGSTLDRRSDVSTSAGGSLAGDAIRSRVIDGLEIQRSKVAKSEDYSKEAKRSRFQQDISMIRSGSDGGEDLHSRLHSDGSAGGVLRPVLAGGQNTRLGVQDNVVGNIGGGIGADVGFAKRHNDLAGSFEKSFGKSDGSAALDDGGGRDYETKMSGGRGGTSYHTSGYTGRSNKGYDTDVDIKASSTMDRESDVSTSAAGSLAGGDAIRSRVIDGLEIQRSKVAKSEDYGKEARRSRFQQDISMIRSGSDEGADLQSRLRSDGSAGGVLRPVLAGGQNTRLGVQGNVVGIIGGGIGADVGFVKRHNDLDGSFEKSFGSSGGSAALDDGGGRDDETKMSGGSGGTSYRTSGYTGRSNKGYDTDVDIRAGSTMDRKSDVSTSAAGSLAGGDAIRSRDIDHIEILTSEVAKSEDYGKEAISRFHQDISMIRSGSDGVANLHSRLRSHGSAGGVLRPVLVGGQNSRLGVQGNVVSNIGGGIGADVSFVKRHNGLGGSFGKSFGRSGGSAALDDGGGRNYETEMSGGRSGTSSEAYDTDVDNTAGSTMDRRTKVFTSAAGSMAGGDAIRNRDIDGLEILRSEEAKSEDSGKQASGFQQDSSMIRLGSEGGADLHSRLRSDGSSGGILRPLLAGIQGKLVGNIGGGIGAGVNFMKRLTGLGGRMKGMISGWGNAEISGKLEKQISLG